MGILSPLGFGLGRLAWNTFSILSIPFTWLILTYPQDVSIELLPLLVISSKTPII